MKTKHQKREEAAARQAIYDRLSPKQRLALAMSRRGSSKKEVKRIRKQMQEKKQ